MAPAFIADSDEESEGAPFSPPPAAQVQEPSFASTRSEVVSLTTSSTDPLFFQSVYKEQIAAARGHNPASQPGGAQFQHSAPAGTEQTDPVSLPSQYPGTPLMVGDANRGFFTNVVRSAMMQGKALRQQEDGGDAADPWAIPSSAEQQSQARSTRRVAKIGSSVAYRATGGIDVGEDENMAPPYKKRQKLDQGNHVESSLPPTAPPLYSSIPPTMPPGGSYTANGEMNDGESTLAPTMSLGNDPSLVIHPRGLTSSQKEEYAAVELPASSHPEQPEPEDGPDELPNTQSNTNERQKQTPRKKATPPRAKRSKQRRRGKSPQAEESMQSVQLGTPEQTQDEKKTITVLPDSEDEGYGEDDTQTVQREEPEEDAYEMQPAPERPTKKQRGRPKKEKATEEATKAEPVADLTHNAGKKGKKRGRPKKSAVVVVDDEEEAPQEMPSENEEAADAASVSDTKLKAIEPETTAVEVVPSKAQQDVAVPVAPVQATPQKPARKGITTPQGMSGKPLYRIGLSKRSRIAPLLKSLRK